jgi:hypothetical protein
VARGFGRWLRDLLQGGEPATAGRDGGRPHPVGGDTEAASALRDWLAARARLDEAFTPMRRRMDAGIDLAALAARREEETLAWNRFRTARLHAGRDEEA